ncbi:hypothetical protein ACWGCW_13455 [Streptomyces sp. NPDC054933]
MLRHQLALPQRHVGRPKLEPGDWVLLAALSRLLPKERWASFFVAPATLLRWHRERSPASVPHPTSDPVARRYRRRHGS